MAMFGLTNPEVASIADGPIRDWAMLYNNISVRSSSKLFESLKIARLRFPKRNMQAKDPTCELTCDSLRFSRSVRVILGFDLRLAGCRDNITLTSRYFEGCAMNAH
jgi:hypothetical protein